MLFRSGPAATTVRSGIWRSPERRRRKLLLRSRSVSAAVLAVMGRRLACSSAREKNAQTLLLLSWYICLFPYFFPLVDRQPSCLSSQREPGLSISESFVHACVSYLSSSYSSSSFFFLSFLSSSLLFSSTRLLFSSLYSKHHEASRARSE